MSPQPAMGEIVELKRRPMRSYGTCAFCGDVRTLCCTKAHTTMCCACDSLLNPYNPTKQSEWTIGPNVEERRKP